MKTTRKTRSREKVSGEPCRSCREENIPPLRELRGISSYSSWLKRTPPRKHLWTETEARTPKATRKRQQGPVRDTTEDSERQTSLSLQRRQRSHPREITTRKIPPTRASSGSNRYSRNWDPAGTTVTPCLPLSQTPRTPSPRSRGHLNEATGTSGRTRHARWIASTTLIGSDLLSTVLSSWGCLQRKDRPS